MTEAIVVGAAYHFWLYEQDDVYYRLYGDMKREKTKVIAPTK